MLGFIGQPWFSWIMDYMGLLVSGLYGYMDIYNIWVSVGIIYIYIGALWIFWDSGGGALLACRRFWDACLQVLFPAARFCLGQVLFCLLGIWIWVSGCLLTPVGFLPPYAIYGFPWS